VLGNPVDEAGHSLVPRGRRIDLSRYFEVQGQPAVLPQRDAEYMRDCGEAIARAYRRETVLMSTHLLAHVLWWRIGQALPTLDLFRRLRQPVELTLPMAEVCADLDRLREKLRARGHHLDPGAAGPAREVIDGAILSFDSYHDDRAVIRVGDDLSPGDRQLLYYYQNRVESLGLSL
jgi:glycerol-3-phosphate O-acyltransferase